MTKTETQIAEKNIRIYTSSKKTPLLFEWVFSHKATCQRFLEFLNNYEKDTGSFYIGNMIFEKITDLKQAIKLYEDVGIK